MKKVSEYYYQKQMRIAKDLRGRAKKIAQEIKEVEILPDCPKCNGEGKATVGNIHGIYGWRSGDSGCEVCKTCKGLGYQKK